MLDRDSILNRAYDECMTEMYAKAQPSADYHQLIQDVKDGKIHDDAINPIYNRHYLSEAEFKYILDKYVTAYGLSDPWVGNMNLLKSYFCGEGMKDVWVKDDEADGHGRRSVEKVPHITDNILEKLKPYIADASTRYEVTRNLTNEILSYIDNCRDFYHHGRDEVRFRSSVALGCSPTSNKDTVISYWKEHGIDVNIIDRNPYLFWDADHYGDEFESVMIDEFGDDWVNVTWNFYFATNDGKIELVSKWLDGNQEYDRHFVHHDGDDLYVVAFDKDVKIPIDDFIKNNNIDWHNFVK